MWVGFQISDEKICIFRQKVVLVGPENVEEKNCGKTNCGWVPKVTDNKFSAYLPQISA